MIYNLYQYLLTNLSSLVFNMHGWDLQSKEQSIAILETGGSPDHDNIKSDTAIQFLSRSLDTNIARSNIYQVYTLLKNRFGLVLPEITVGETLFPEVKTYQISPIQVPGYLGADGRNLEIWSFNIIVTMDNP